MQLRFAKAHHQIPLEEKVGVALGYGSSPKFGASPFIFLQRPLCPLNVSGASCSGFHVCILTCLVLSRAALFIKVTFCFIVFLVVYLVVHTGAIN